MPAEFVSEASSTRRLRADHAEDAAPILTPALTVAAWAALAAGLVLACAGNLDLNAAESRLAMAVGAPLGPYGQVFGKWEPGIWPAQVAAGRLWAWGERAGLPTAASLRWPSAIAGLILGAILSRRLGTQLGARAGLFLGLTWFGSLALMDRSALLGLDLVAALGVVAALDRLLGKGTDLVAGTWAALAFLAGGWPPLAIVGAAMIVLGRPSTRMTWKLALPPALAIVGWSAWALSVAPGDKPLEAWAAALCLPLTKGPAWTLALEVIALGLPWTPLAALAAYRPVREGWSEGPRAMVMGWLQVSGAAILAGTLIPGLAQAARLPAIAGLAIAAAAVLDRAWVGGLPNGPRRAFLAASTTIVAFWAIVGGPIWAYLIMAIGYYRTISIALLIVGWCLLLAGVLSAASGRPRWAVGALAGVALALKLAHAGIYVPEWDYRMSQGPWGRAIGQWAPPRWPIYTLHDWPADLAFATGHPIRQLVDERQLSDVKSPGPHYVLLLPEEFAHWRPDAPKLVKSRKFLDQHGQGRILAWTEGNTAWYRLIREAKDRE